MVKTDKQLDALIESVLSSTKYKHVSPELIRSIGEQELAHRHNAKEAVKATKNKLHQVGGAYLSGKERYSAWLEELRAAVNSENIATLQQVCREMMFNHASTRERLPILDEFYATLLADLRPVRRILDIACGLNPLAIPWMALEAGSTYYACDIYQDMTAFLYEWIGLLGLRGEAYVCDVLQTCPTQEVDVAFVLKALPCLEQLDKHAGARLLHGLNAQHIVISFPAHSLGGRGKGMVTNYTTHFYELIKDEPWTVRRYNFATELVFVLDK